jgi:hypothetical protein
MKVSIHEANDLDLNAASEDELADVGLGAGRARRIIEARPFRDWEEVSRVEGLTEQVVSQLRGAGAVLGPPNPESEVSHAKSGHDRDLLDKSIRADTPPGGPGERSATRPKN